MKQNFAFATFSKTISGIISLPLSAKEKKNPFIIVNTDNDHGLYVKKLEKEIDKYKGLKLSDSSADLYDIEKNNLIVFGDSHKYDYRIEMNEITLTALTGKDVRVYDIVDDFDRIVRRLSTYCKNNGIKRKNAYRDECCVNLRVNVVEEPKVICPLAARKYRVYEEPKVKKTLVNVYSKPNVSVEKITVHSNWVKIGWNQYDIFVDLFGNEFITLEDGDKLFVKEDRFGRRYLAT
jgi:hypothetical protein